MEDKQEWGMISQPPPNRTKKMRQPEVAESIAVVKVMFLVGICN